MNVGSTAQFVTIRLAGSVPDALVVQWQGRDPSLPRAERQTLFDERMNAHLDRGEGPTWLADPRIAALVAESLVHLAQARCTLHAWVIMPNHVHLLATLAESERIAAFMASLKRFTARQANECLGRTGPFWQRDYFDRYIRDPRHFEATAAYIEHNPVTAGLVARPEDWPWSSARPRPFG